VAIWWQFLQVRLKKWHFSGKNLRKFPGKSGKKLRDSAPNRGKIGKTQEETSNPSGITKTVLAAGQSLSVCPLNILNPVSIVNGLSRIVIVKK
jgi:hypothetical protein